MTDERVLRHLEKAIQLADENERELLRDVYRTFTHGGINLDGIGVHLSLRDPNAFDGERLHIQHHITEHELEHSQSEPREHLDMILRQRSRDMVEKWAEGRDGGGD